MPANAILVPGIILAGPATHLVRLSSVQVMFAAFIGAGIVEAVNGRGFAAHDSEQIGAHAIAAILLDIVTNGAARKDGLALGGIAVGESLARQQANRDKRRGGNFPIRHQLFLLSRAPIAFADLHAHAQLFNTPKVFKTPHFRRFLRRARIGFTRRRKLAFSLRAPV